MIVEVSTTTKEASAFTELQTITDGEITTSWAQKIVDVSAYVGQPIYIAFHVVDNNGSTIWIDDVAGVTIKAETCPKTNAPEASSIGTTSATITWTANGTEEEWNLRYKKSSDSEWTEVKGLKTKSYDLTGLTPGKTSYDYEVQAVCGSEDKSDWKAGVAFQTECATETLPYKPTFSDGVKPGCWDIADNVWGSGWAGRWYTYYVSTGNYGLQYYINSTSASAVAITTPSIEITEPAILAFSYSNYYSGRKVTSTVTISDGKTSKVLSLKNATSTSLVDTIIDLSDVDGTDFTNKTITVAFAGSKSSSNSASYLKIANISVERKPCPVPGVPEYSNVTTTSATLTWAKAEDVEDYVFSCVRKGLNPVWGTAQQKLTVTIDTLKQNTEYDFYVRTFCSVGDSSEVKSVSFQTENACSAPTITSTTITYDGATFEWSGDGDNYQYAVTETNAAPESWTDIAAKTVTITNHASGVKRYFHVRANCGAESKSDEASAEFTPLCPAPTALDTVNETLSTHSVSIHWTAAEGITTYQYVALPSTSALDWSDAKTTTNTSVELTGLASGTTYKAYVRSYFSEYSQSTSISKEFDTECEAQAIGWSENFGTAAEVKPNCWNIANWGTSANYWTTAGDYAKTGVALRYNARTVSSSDAITPSIEITDKCQLTFYIRNSVGSNSAKVECKVLVNDGNETTEIAHITTRYTTATLQTLDLSAYKGKTVTIIFRGMGYDTSGSPYLWIDDVAISYLPVATPTNLTATPANASAVVTWERAEADAKDSLRYRVNGSEDEWTKVANIEGKTYTIESLTNSTTYEVQVKTVASANRQSDWTASAVVTPVACASVETVTFGAKTYNSVVVNWTTTGAGTWNIRYKTAKDQDWTIVEGNIAENTKKLEELTPGEVYTIAVKPSCNDGEEAWVAAAETYTPLYTAPSNVKVTGITETTASASWDAVADAPDGYLYVVSAKDAEPAWNKATQTEELTASLSNLEAATEYDLHVVTKYGQYYSSDSKVSFTTSTVAPKNLTAGEITTTTATFTWENDGTATKYEYAVGDDPTALVWDEVSEKTKTLEGLTANTSYTFYVRAKYSNEVKSDSVNITFRTDCNAIAELPWFEGFEDMAVGNYKSAAPACWAQLNVNDGLPYAYVNNSSAYVKTGSKSMCVVSSSLTDGYLILPAFEAALNGLQISFSHIEENETKSVVLTLGYITDIANAETFVAVKEFGRATSWQEEAEISLASIPNEVATTARLAFKLGKATDNWFTGIDDITVSVLPNCRKPIIGETTILPDGATITWTAGGDETKFQYAVDTTETLVWTATESTEATVHGLVPGNNYKFYVRAFCDPEVGDSVWTAFAPVCNAPTEAALTATTTTTASFSWTAAANITSYQYVVMAKGVAADWSKAETTANTTAEWTELAANTAYDFYVRSFFNESVQSAAASISFRTECAAIAALPWSENFEGQTLNEAPACWEVVDPNNTNIYVSTGSTWFDLGTTGLFFEGASANYGYILLPEFEAALNTLQISFSHSEESSSSSGKIELGYYKDSEFTSLKAYDQSQKAWKAEGPFALTDVPAGARLAFGYKTNSETYAAAIDNITIEEIPACAVPTDLAASEVTAASATLSWTSEASNFTVQYTTDKENWGDEHEVTAKTLAIDGLAEHTTYYARVKAVCGAENESEYCEEISFTTPWTAQSYPYAYSFGETLDAHWSVTTPHGTSNWNMVSENENYFAQFKTTNNSYNYSILQTPEVVIPSECDPYLIFNWRNTGAVAEVKISVNGAEAYILSTDFNTELNTATNTWTLKKISLAAYKGQTVRILFYASSGSNANKYAELDEVRFAEKPCLVPTNLTVQAGNTKADVAWTKGEDETAWQLQYKTTAAEDWTLVENITSEAYSITGLANGTEYEVQVRAYCDENHQSAWTASVVFTPSESTAVGNINAGEKVVKLIENNQLVIIRDGVKYNAQGQKID